MERRTVQCQRPRLLRSVDGKAPSRIEGYAAVFYRADDPGTEYELFRYGNFSAVERLMHGCFDRAIREDDVRALFNHDVNQILGRTGSGTCKLSTDAIGLKYVITPADTSYARDLMACLQRGDVSGSSFSFEYLDRSERDISNPDGTERTVLEVYSVKLYDVGPVTFPAYSSTSATARKHTTPRLPTTPLAMSARADQVEAELRELYKRLRFRRRRSRRERVRSRADEVLQRLELDRLDNEVAKAREAFAARRRRSAR